MTSSVDGVWSEWSMWTSCSVTCENGTQSRGRLCTEPQYGGAACLGSNDELRDCYPRECPGKTSIVNAGGGCYRGCERTHPDAHHTAHARARRSRAYNVTVIYTLLYLFIDTTSLHPLTFISTNYPTTLNFKSSRTTTNLYLNSLPASRGTNFDYITLYKWTAPGCTGANGVNARQLATEENNYENDDVNIRFTEVIGVPGMITKCRNAPLIIAQVRQRIVCNLQQV